LRPRPDLADKVASPPYDVLDSEEARKLGSGNPYSFLHVVKAEIDLPADPAPAGEDIYARSAINFRGMIAEGVLIRDPEPCFYLYRLGMGEHEQTGLVAACSVDEYESGKIKKHEFTRRDKEDDRARHVEALMANAGPVLLTYRQRPGIRELFDEIRRERKPVYDFACDDGIRHTLWVISRPSVKEEVQKVFRPLEALYIADGHHRSASAHRVRDILRAANPEHNGQEAYNYFLAVLFPDDELKIMGYHRVLRDLNGLDAETFIARVAEKFDVSRATRPEPDAQKSWGMYLDGEWYRLIAKPGSYPEDDPIRSLDASILQENLLSPVLGIGDPRVDARIDFVGGIRGSAELERRCEVDMKVAFACAAVSVEQLMAVADRGEVMPPKSTWFEPKLRSGVVVRSLEE